MPEPTSVPHTKKGREHLLAKEIYGLLFPDQPSKVQVGHGKFAIVVSGYVYKVEVKEVGIRKSDSVAEG